MSLEHRNFSTVEASISAEGSSYLLMPHKTHFNVTPDKLSPHFISSKNSRKVFPFCWHWSQLVRMLQKLLVRNSLHWPYWHSCVNWVRAAKSLCSKFSPPALLSLHSHLFFQEFVCGVFLAHSSCTHRSCHRQHKSPWWKKPSVHPLVAAAESHHLPRSLQGLISPLATHQERRAVFLLSRCNTWDIVSSTSTGQGCL